MPIETLSNLGFPFSLFFLDMFDLRTSAGSLTTGLNVIYNSSSDLLSALSKDSLLTCISNVCICALISLL